MVEHSTLRYDILGSAAHHRTILALALPVLLI
jgi:hypothetical protein